MYTAFAWSFNSYISEKIVFSDIMNSAALPPWAVKEIFYW